MGDLVPSELLSTASVNISYVETIKTFDSKNVYFKTKIGKNSVMFKIHRTLPAIATSLNIFQQIWCLEEQFILLSFFKN